MMLEVTRRGVQDLDNWPITSVGQTISSISFLIRSSAVAKRQLLATLRFPFLEDGSRSYQCLTIAEGHPN
jgi:hypothetical protein